MDGLAFSLHVGYGRLFPALDSFEQENQREAAQRQPAEQSEIVHKRPQMRLPVQRLVDEAVGLARGGHRIGVPRQRELQAGQTVVNAGSVGDKCPTISAWCLCAPRAIMVVTNAMPTLPPTLRMRL